MVARTGEQFLAGIKGEREIWLGNERVKDVTSHPSLSGTAHFLASFFDLQYEKSEDCLFPDPETGEAINISHIIPKSKQDIERRHRGLRCIAEKSLGILGRTADYKNVIFAGFAGCHDEWSFDGNEAGAERMINYQKEIRRNDLLLTHTLINPTIDKSKMGSLLPDNEVALHKVCDTEHGMIVRGARLLATLAPFADELAVYPAAPLPPGSHEKFAIAFCIPIGTPGLKFLCRDSFSSSGYSYNHPLSSKFDEQDAFIIFDDVEVPRNRIFLDGHINVYNQVTRKTWGANVMQQTNIRAQTKLEFAWGLGTAMMDAIGDKNPQTQQMLGEIWTYSQLVKSSIEAAEAGSREYSNGVWFPDVWPFRAATACLPQWMTRVGEILRLIGSHNLLTTPTWEMLQQPTLRKSIDLYLDGAGDVDAQTRAALFRMAWDYIGSALAGRSELYESFYLGPAWRHQTTIQLLADKTRANRLVESLLT